MADIADTVLLVEKAMTSEEREQFMRKWLTINPRYNGATVADVLDELIEGDANLDVVEPIWEAHHDDFDDLGMPQLLRACTLAMLYTHGQVYWMGVSDLLGRAKEYFDYH
jgi:hypothetical protein